MGLTDLPKLKDVKEMAQAEINSYAILGDKINIRNFIDDTFANFEKLIKTHAAAHQKKRDEINEKEIVEANINGLALYQLPEK